MFWCGIASICGIPPMDVDETDNANYQKANEPFFLTAGAAMRVFTFFQKEHVLFQYVSDVQTGFSLESFVS